MIKRVLKISRHIGEEVKIWYTSVGEICQSGGEEIQTSVVNNSTSDLIEKHHPFLQIL